MLGDCTEDVNQEGVIDEDDLDLVTIPGSQVLCPAGEICWRDVNGDAVIDAIDRRLVMLKLHTACDTGGGGEMAEIIEVWQAVGGDDRLVNQTISVGAVGEALGHETVEEKTERMFALLAE
jgi:hypothetical protein